METKIMELERKYWNGMENHDYETVKSLTHFPCIVAGKNGVRSVDEATFKTMFESGAGDKIKVVSLRNFETQQLGEATVVTAYLIDLALTDAPQKPPMKCACTSTWIQENGSWVCALHTESELAEQQ